MCAKVVNPLLSMEASGQVGSALVYGKRKGANVVRIYTIPSNPQTLTQMANRAFLAAAGKISKVADLTETVVAFLKLHAPSTQTWNSYFSKEILGNNNSNIEAAKVAYNTGGNATVKGYFDDAAAQAGVEAVDLDGTSNTQVAAGLALWAAYDAAHRLGSTDAPTIASAASEGQVFAFTDALTGILPT